MDIPEDEYIDEYAIRYYQTKDGITRVKIPLDENGCNICPCGCGEFTL